MIVCLTFADCLYEECIAGKSHLTDDQKRSMEKDFIVSIVMRCHNSIELRPVENS